MCNKSLLEYNSKSNYSDFGLKLLEHEKKKIAEELHDHISCKLSILRLKLNSQTQVSNDIIMLLDNTISSVRHLSHNLHSHALRHIGLIDAIKDCVMPLHGLIEVEIDCNAKEEYQLNYFTKLNVLRIFQEVIHNILKHAKASKINIQLCMTFDKLSLMVKDNGEGFGQGQIDKFGIGLENIKHRANELKARYRFAMSRPRGTTFHIFVPLVKNQPINGH